MTDERLILALGRIARAVSRLEGAELATAAAAPADLALAERHATLRARTAEAIARLDALLRETATAADEPSAATPVEEAR